MNEWQEACWTIAEEKGFHLEVERPLEGTVRDASPVERMMLIVSEVSEMLEAFRLSKKPGQLYTEVDGKPEGVAAELADVVIRCLDYAAIYDIDLGFVMQQKLMYNTTRPFRHGNKEV
jgi:NTP pyrophosphatase (non-canonical NTP hydrolase)